MNLSQPNWIGAQLDRGRYSIASLLGQGGMGLVYYGRDNRLGVEVVVKTPRAGNYGDNFATRFQNEVRSLIQLSHPHIVPVLDVGEHQGAPYAVMQYLAGGSLAARQGKGRSGKSHPLAPASLAYWLPAVAEALDYVHGRQMVHRDVKPANILFHKSGDAFLGDFGLVKALAAEGAAAREVSALRVFICHSSEQASLALELAQSLERAGLSCWIAPRDVRKGSVFAEEIVRGIRRCSALVLLHSAAADASPYVLREINEAVSQRKPILPLRLGEFTTSDRMGFYLGAVQWLPLELAGGRIQPESVITGLNNLLSRSGVAELPRVSGSPGYRPPEARHGIWDARSDQFALAMAAYNVLVGFNPQEHSSDGATPREIPPPHALLQSIPRGVSEAIHRGLALRPEDRYPSATALAEAVITALNSPADENFILPRPPTPAPPSPLPAPPAPVQKPLSASSCPLCGNRLVLPVVTGLRRVRCPHCNAALQISADLKQLSPAPERDSSEEQQNSHPTPAPTPAPTPPRPSPVDPPHFQDKAQKQPAPTPAPVRRSSNRWLPTASLLCLALVLGVGWIYWKSAGLVTRDDAIRGVMKIEFHSRNPSSAQTADVYQPDLQVCTSAGEFVRYQGVIFRYSTTRGLPSGTSDVAGMRFQLQTLREAESARDAAPEVLGSISGFTPLTQGAYAFDGLQYTAASGRATSFGGSAQGKSGPDSQHADKQLVVEHRGRLVRYQVKSSDPMIFHDLLLPADPGVGAPAMRVTGELTYSYETASYLTTDLAFHNVNDASDVDYVQGTIIWQKGDQYAVDHKSRYVFQLRFAPQPPKTQASGNAENYQGEESDLFAADGVSDSRRLTGVIDYTDQGVGDEDNFTPYSSQVEYHLHAHRLTVRQLHTFLKVWLLMTSPLNDE